MSPADFEVLSEKVKNGTATPEERLSFLKELNSAIEDVQSILEIKKD